MKSITPHYHWVADGPDVWQCANCGYESNNELELFDHPAHRQTLLCRPCHEEYLTDNNFTLAGDVSLECALRREPSAGRLAHDTGLS